VLQAPGRLVRFWGGLKGYIDDSDRLPALAIYGFWNFVI
jgi:hypothetical protein